MFPKEFTGSYYIPAHKNLVAKGKLYSQYTSHVKKHANLNLESDIDTDNKWTEQALIFVQVSG